MDQLSWQQALLHFEDIAKGYKGRGGYGGTFDSDMAIADICRYIINNRKLSQTLEVRNISSHALFIGPVYSFPNKQFKAEAILGNEVEFCLKDSTAGVERYFLPHAPYNDALDRFKKILSNISWESPVKKNSWTDMFFQPMVK